MVGMDYTEAVDCALKTWVNVMMQVVMCQSVEVTDVPKFGIADAAHCLGRSSGFVTVGGGAGGCEDTGCTTGSADM